MIGDLLNNNKRREVKTREDQVMYMGRKYRREASGYYMCTTGSRRRLHDVIWETEAGRRVPPGCVIHHVNWDKSVNEVWNLVCVTVAEHERIHNSHMLAPGGREFGENLKKQRGLDCPPGY